MVLFFDIFILSMLKTKFQLQNAVHKNCLEPCRKYHVIAIDSDGTFSKSLFFRDVRIESLFHSNDVNEQRVDEFDFEDECDCEEAFALNHNTVFEVVQPGT